MCRSSKKGPFVEERLLARIQAMNDRRLEADDPHLVALVHGLPRHGRPHDRGPRRQASTCRSSSRSRWSGTSSASSRRRATSAATRATSKTQVKTMTAATSRGAGRGEVRPRARRARRGSSSTISAAARVPEARTILAFTHARRRARGREGAAQRGRERRGERTLGRRRAGRRGRLRRRRPDDQALARRARAAASNRILKRTCHITIKVEQLDPTASPGSARTGCAGRSRRPQAGGTAGGAAAAKPKTRKKKEAAA